MGADLMIPRSHICFELCTSHEIMEIYLIGRLTEIPKVAVQYVIELISQIAQWKNLLHKARVNCRAKNIIIYGLGMKGMSKQVDMMVSGCHAEEPKATITYLRVRLWLHDCYRQPSRLILPRNLEFDLRL